MGTYFDRVLLRLFQDHAMDAECRPLSPRKKAVGMFHGVAPDNSLLSTLPICLTA
jgi:hypothetical protein